MIARTYREIEAWQLASELRRRIVEIVATSQAGSDRKFRDQLLGSAASVASNIAEGFGRFNPGDFARFLGIARGSLDETDNHLRDGVERGYFSAEAAAPLILLAARCRAAVNALQAYLRRAARQKARNRRKEPS